MFSKSSIFLQYIAKKSYNAGHCKKVQKRTKRLPEVQKKMIFDRKTRFLEEKIPFLWM